MPKLILGSQSPRRERLLNTFSLKFTQASPPFDERSVVFDGDPVRYVLQQSYGKAESLVPQHKKSAILTADTVVYFDGKLYEKPADELVAYNTLAALSNKWHQVFTGITLYYQEEYHQAFQETRVLFNELSEAHIRTYLKRVHWADKAGGYAIQAGGLLIKRIDGSFDNVMGFPLNIVSQLLEKIGIDLWDYLKDS